MNLKTKTNTVKQILAKVMIVVLLVVSVISFSACAPKVELAKPENTNLEYWLLDKLDNEGCTKLDAIVGTKVEFYLAKGYEAIVTENGKLGAPESAVVYEIEKYPYRDWGILWRIGSIKISDPDVFVWGLTINSTREEFSKVMTDLGFEFRSEDETYIAFSLDKYYVGLRYGEYLRITYDIPFFGTFFF